VLELSVLELRVLELSVLELIRAGAQCAGAQGAGDDPTEEKQPGGMTVEPRHLWRAEPGTHGIPLFDLAAGGPLRRGAGVSQRNDSQVVQGIWI